jgi:hypothetical protein
MGILEIIRHRNSGVQSFVQLKSYVHWSHEGETSSAGLVRDERDGWRAIFIVVQAQAELPNRTWSSVSPGAVELHMRPKNTPRLQSIYCEPLVSQGGIIEATRSDKKQAINSSLAR